VCARVGNQQSRGVVTARVRTDAVRSLRHQRRDLHQSTYPIPLGISGLILLSDLDLPISEEEIKGVVASMPKENPPMPDGFIGAFYSKCWDIVKGDVIAAVLQLPQLRGDTFHLLNTTNIFIHPKKENWSPQAKVTSSKRDAFTVISSSSKESSRTFTPRKPRLSSLSSTSPKSLTPSCGHIFWRCYKNWGSVTNGGTG
jgi:hypothetical protein